MVLKSLLKDIVSRTPRSAETPVEHPSGAPRPCDDWLRDIVVRAFMLMHRSEPDNFDAVRYRGRPSNEFFYDQHADYFLMLLRNVDRFHHARQLLADDASRALFDTLVLYRILGHLHVRLPFNTPENRAQVARAQEWWREDTADTGPFGPLAIYEVPRVDGNIRVKCWKENVTYTFLYRQYYFEREGVAVRPEAGHHAIDAGGCFGDTALGFADAVGAAGHVYAFDPLPKHCAIMREQLALNPRLAPRISIYPYGLSDHDNDVPLLVEDGVINPGARLAAAEMPMATIDRMVAQAGAPRVDFIKMDIEGSELAALRGAESTIRRWKPRLAISLYHRPEDFFTIPAWLDALGIGYRFFLDHYSIHQEETVLFATAS